MSFFCTTLSLIFGLYFLKGNVVISILLSLSYLIFILIRFGKKSFLISLLLFSVGGTLANINLEYNSNNSVFEGFVVETKKNYIVFQSHCEKYYIYQENNKFEIGDYLEISGYPSDLKITTYESQFDFKNYLNNKGIKRELKATNIDSKYSSFLKIKAFKNKFISNFDENTGALINAFLFNEKDYSSNAVKITSNLKLNHLFTLSGVYLHLMFAALGYLLSLKFSNKASEILPFIILLPYAFFSLNKIGTLRVYSIYFLRYLNKYKFKKKLLYIELITLLALFFLIFDYHLVYQETFYIGFLLSMMIPFLQNALKIYKKKKTKLLFPLFLYIFTFPITIENGTFNVLTILFSSLMFIPCFVFLLLSILSLIIPLYALTNTLGGGITWILEKMELINFSVPISNLGGTFSLIFYSLVLTGIYFLEGIRIKHLKITACALLALITCCIVPLQEPLINAVYFINVGQGDSILIKNRTKTVMIDTGGYKNCDMAMDTLIPFMNKNKITHIDYLILTHDDFDHSGAKESLIENFKVKYCITEKQQFPLSVGDLIIQNLNNYETNDENDSSLVLYMKFINKKWLFMGDSSKTIEKYLINNYVDLDCDILKVGHHGSNTSTSEEFIRKTTPNTAIISVGENNYYGHPSNDVISCLEKYKINIRRTDKEGTISYLSLMA